MPDWLMIFFAFCIDAGLCVLLRAAVRYWLRPAEARRRRGSL